MLIRLAFLVLVASTLFGGEQDALIVKKIFDYLRANAETIIPPSYEEANYYHGNFLRDSQDNPCYEIGALVQGKDTYLMVFSIKGNTLEETLVHLLYITRDKDRMLSPKLFYDVKNLVSISSGFPKSLYNSFVMIEELQKVGDARMQMWTFFNKEKSFSVNIALSEDQEGRAVFRIIQGASE